MPTYDYVCKNCDHEWELFQPIKSSPIRKCPECGKLKAKRVIGPGAGIIFKGTGFYQTDYRSEAYRKSAEADKKAREKSEGKSDSKSQSGSASDAKTDSKSKTSKSSD